MQLEPLRTTVGTQGKLKDVVGNYTGKVCQGKTMKGFECQAEKLKV